MNLQQTLSTVDLFEGLTEAEIAKVASICREQRFNSNQVIAREGDAGDEFYIIAEGFVEILLGERPATAARIIVSLGSGQIIGEMALLDHGPRSASLRAASEPTVVQVIKQTDFENLCQNDSRIGYIVMRNLAADMAFKLRHRNLSDR